MKTASPQRLHGRMCGFLLAVPVACSAGGGAPGTGATPGSGGETSGSGGFVGTGAVPGSSGGASTGGQTGVPQGGGGVPAGTGGQPASGGSPGTGGTTASGGASGTGGTTYDPTVTFDWPEAVATAGSCKAGKYSGTFDGLYLSPAAFGAPVPIAGNVDLVLQESQDGEFFKLADGKISGFVFGTIPFSSGLTGSLNCTTAKLEDGFMPNGTYNAFGTNYFYEGPLDADYDKLANAFVNGKWIVGEPTYQRGAPRTQFGGEGTWTVKYVGP